VRFGARRCDRTIDNIKGVVAIKDMYVSPDDVFLKDLMRPALFVPENNTAFQVMEKFKESFHIALASLASNDL
jgi:putative hemolysin